MRKLIVIGAVIFTYWSGFGPGPSATLHAAEPTSRAKPAMRTAAVPPSPSSARPCQGVLMLPGAPLSPGKSTSGSVVSGDFNGDGLQDLAVSNWAEPQVFIRLSNGNGTFKPEVGYPLAKGSAQIISGDWNGDGKLDIASASSKDATVSLLLGRGNGTFAPAVSYTIGSKPSALARGDTYGD